MIQGEDSKQPWTPLKIIQWAVPFLSQKGIPNPRFDVEILIAFALKIDRLKVYLQFDRPLGPDELASIREFLKRRATFEPIQYITGQREFYGYRFKVNRDVLIPRPETEMLVEKAIEHLKKIPVERRLILDLGTGSGCIALSIAKSIECKVWAVDFSQKALEIALENAKIMGMESIQWRKGDWFSALLPLDPLEFQVILSNPPYISLGEKEELSHEVKDFEPPEALFAGENGLESYVQIAKKLRERLAEGGVAFLELNANRHDRVIALFNGFRAQNLYEDLQGIPRVLKLEK